MRVLLTPLYKDFLLLIRDKSWINITLRYANGSCPDYDFNVRRCNECRQKDSIFLFSIK